MCFACDEQTRDAFQWSRLMSEILGGQNTSENVVKDRRTNNHEINACIEYTVRVSVHLYRVVAVMLFEHNITGSHHKELKRVSTF